MPDFRIFLGTYEHSLVGLDATWSPDADSIELKMVVAYSTHIGSLKCIAVGGQYLASGSTDEVIKYIVAKTYS